MSSREGTPISVDADEFSLGNVSDSGLKALLQEETKLKAQLDALTTEIAKLETQVNPTPKEDDDEGMMRTEGYKGGEKRGEASRGEARLFELEKSCIYRLC